MEQIHSTHLPQRLSDHFGRWVGKDIRARGLEWPEGNHVVWTQQPHRLAHRRHGITQKTCLSTETGVDTKFHFSWELVEIVCWERASQFFSKCVTPDPHTSLLTYPDLPLTLQVWNNSPFYSPVTGSRNSPDQWFSTFMMMQSFNTVPRVAVTPPP